MYDVKSCFYLEHECFIILDIVTKDDILPRQQAVACGLWHSEAYYSDAVRLSGIMVGLVVCHLAPHMTRDERFRIQRHGSFRLRLRSMLRLALLPGVSTVC